jgi:hypothetical protein
MLYRYSGIALQFWGIRGKKGRHRKQLGTVVRTASGDIKFSGDNFKIETDKQGRRTVYLDLSADPDFDMLEFRRALYRIALSTVAVLESEEDALEPKFDEARCYIRSPKPGEAWPFAQGQTPLPWLSANPRRSKLRNEPSRLFATPHPPAKSSGRQHALGTRRVSRPTGGPRRRAGRRGLPHRRGRTRAARLRRAPRPRSD